MADEILRPTVVPERLLILGTRKFASEVADIAEDAGHEVVGYVENMDPERCRLPKDDLPVYWIDDVGPLAHDHTVICALATTRRSRFVEDAVARDLRFATVVHPSALVSKRSHAGDGSILGVGCVVAAYVTLGHHVLLNRAALIGHHTTVGDYTTVGPGANIAGSCTVGKAVYVGMLSSRSRQPHHRRRLGHRRRAVVTRDVDDHTMVAGVPAKVKKRGIEGK